RVNNRYIAAVASLSDVAGFYGSTSKVLRLLLQSMILGLGAYLVIKQELTAGAMIAASIMMGGALAPIETTIANWRAFVAARQSIRRLSDTHGPLRKRGAQPVGSRASRPPHWICRADGLAVRRNPLREHRENGRGPRRRRRAPRRPGCRR